MVSCPSPSLVLQWNKKQHFMKTLKKRNSNQNETLTHDWVDPRWVSDRLDPSRRQLRICFNLKKKEMKKFLILISKHQNNNNKKIEKTKKSII